MTSNRQKKTAFDIEIFPKNNKHEIFRNMQKRNIKIMLEAISQENLDRNSQLEIQPEQEIKKLYTRIMQLIYGYFLDKNLEHLLKGNPASGVLE